MGWTLGFGSGMVLLFRFHFVIFLTLPYHLQIHYTKGTPFLFSGCSGLSQFSDLFHLALLFFSSFTHVTFFTIGVSVYLALEVWFPCFQSSFRWSTFSLQAPLLKGAWSRPHLERFWAYLILTYGTRLPSMLFSVSIWLLAFSVSLATTSLISLDFFSFCYLDVSVHRVSFWYILLFMAYSLL